jgi:hypothetical protein
MAPKYFKRHFHNKEKGGLLQHRPRIREFVHKTVSNLQLISRQFTGVLSDELCHTLTAFIKSWDDQMLADVDNNPVYKDACRCVRDKTDIKYPMWFVLATAFGPGHPRLGEIRAAISAKWAFDFPADAIAYPDVQKEHQRRLSFGELVQTAEPATGPKTTPTTGDALVAESSPLLPEATAEIASLPSTDDDSPEPAGKGKPVEQKKLSFLMQGIMDQTLGATPETRIQPPEAEGAVTEDQIQIPDSSITPS